MKRFLVTLAGIALLILPAAALAELPHTALALQVAEVHQKNAALMHQYTWESRSELKLNGVSKDVRLEQNLFGPDGTLQRTLINDQGAPLPSGFLRRMIAKKDLEKTQLYVKSLVGLLEQYTLPSNGKIIDFITQSVVSPLDANGLLQITGSNVVSPGDQVTIWVNGTTNKISRMSVITAFQQDQVSLSANFKTDAAGLNYLAYGEADVVAKGVVLLRQNFNYQNQGK